MPTKEHIEFIRDKCTRIGFQPRGSITPFGKQCIDMLAEGFGDPHPGLTPVAWELTKWGNKVCMFRINLESVTTHIAHRPGWHTLTGLVIAAHNHGITLDIKFGTGRYITFALTDTDNHPPMAAALQVHQTRTDELNGKGPTS